MISRDKRIIPGRNKLTDSLPAPVNIFVDNFHFSDGPIGVETHEKKPVQTDVCCIRGRFADKREIANRNYPAVHKNVLLPESRIRVPQVQQYLFASGGIDLNELNHFGRYKNPS